MTQPDITIILAPPGAVCAACQQPCAGELVETDGLTFLHADRAVCEAACLAAWEAAAVRAAKLRVFVEASE